MRLKSRSYVLLALLAACALPGEDSDGGGGAAADRKRPKVCVALRGNGQAILAHMGGLAQVQERIGHKIDGLAGGSSSTITMFLYESMLRSPVLKTCNGKPCTEKEQAVRLSLLLKSVEGYIESVGTLDGLINDPALEGFSKTFHEHIGDVREFLTNPVNTTTQLAKVWFEFLSKFDRNGVDRVRRVISKDWEHLFAVIPPPPLPNVFNAEARRAFEEKFAANVELWKFRAKEAYQAAASLGKFSVPNNRLFFRTGLIDWNEAPKVFARAADFYAGSDKAIDDKMVAFADMCAVPMRGMPWRESKKLVAKQTEPVAQRDVQNNCASQFSDIVQLYFAHIDANSFEQKRLTQHISEPSEGETTALIAITSLVTGDSALSYDKALEDYRAGKVPAPDLDETDAAKKAKGQIPWTPKFADIKYGYWGRADIIEPLSERNLHKRRFRNAKMDKSVILGQASYDEILFRSPGEPGLQNLPKFRQARGDMEALALRGRVNSSGGWPNLAPVEVMRETVCTGEKDEVVYLTVGRPEAGSPEKPIAQFAEASESQFPIQIAAQLGMDDQTKREIYDPELPRSSINQALGATSHVLCTHWGRYDANPPEDIFADAYYTPLVTPKEADEPGCTPGKGKLLF
jgi:hypothetical protein